MLDYLIIDPASTEFNRGSFCYLPYILYNALKEGGWNVKIVEDFTVANLDNLPKAKNIYVALWSYPQIEACQVIHKLQTQSVKFFGYRPLINKLGLPFKNIENDTILEGLKAYPKYYKDFKYLLLSDCDMHLNKYEGVVYPMFTSYGCPKSCSFCPASVNCYQHRLELDVKDVLGMLWDCRKNGIFNIHFTDEDFFWNTDRAHAILSESVGKGMNFIMLGSVEKVQKFVDTHGEYLLIEAGVKLIEVGFETGDPALSKKMNKTVKSQYAYEALAKSLKEVKVLWLTLTFFPGETIATLNKTGDFLRSFGLDSKELYGRIRTNGTEGGLGQFFQLYDGVKDFDRIAKEGEILTERPMRLIPSYIPTSFKESVIKDIIIEPMTTYWLSLYKLDVHLFFWIGCEGKKIKDVAKSTDDYVALAVLARLGVIR